MNFNNFINFCLTLIPWFIAAIIFKVDSSYYNNLNLPFFALPDFLFGIIWSILYILIAISIYLVYKDSDKEYKEILVVNFISNQLFTFFFFVLKNNFLAVIDTIVLTISTFYLYRKTTTINKKASYLLIPYLIFSVFALLLILTIAFMN